MSIPLRTERDIGEVAAAESGRLDACRFGGDAAKGYCDG